MEIESIESLSNQRLVVECIEVPKVYDFCFQAERRENVCTPLPPGFMPPAGATVRCIITETTCEEIGRSQPNKQGRANVTIAVTVTFNLEILDPMGNVVKVITDAVDGFTKTVTLCAPVEPFPTTIVCQIVNSTCGPCLILGNQICCSFDLCLVIQSIAVVKLLVPSFGFCVPALCEEVAPTPPFVCPPVLFPPQCPPLR